MAYIYLLESIIMKPRREEIEDSSQILYESSHEMDSSKLKQKKRYTVHHWSETETHLFFKAISQFGTDFGMIKNNIFPLRSRLEIKNKFKREERQHPIRMDRALRKNIPVMQFLTHEDLKNAESVSVEEKKGN